MATERVVSVRLALKNDGFLSGMRQSRKAVSDFSNDLTTGAKKHKRDLDEIGRVSAGVGLVAGAGIALAIKKFADFDKAMSNVRAATHETAGNMAALREAALQAGADTAFSATQAAGAIENLAKAGVSTKDILGGGLKGALDLAAAGELEVGQAAETAATAMTQFKLKGTDVPHIADLLAAAAGKAQGEVSDMAQALNQSGLVAAEMGLSIEETTGTLAAFASAGLLGSDAGTSFKTMLLRLANPAGEAATAMDELGIHAYDAQGAFIGIAPLAEQLQSKLKNLTQEQRDSALATIFGSDAIRAANVLYQNGATGIADWTTKVNDAGFAAETAAIKQDNLRGDLEKLGGSFETALIKLGEDADGVLRSLTQGATGAVDAFGDLPGPVKQGALALGAVAAVGGLSAAGLLKAATTAAELRTAWTNLGRTGRTLTLSMGAVGVALAAAAVVYGIFSQRNQEAEQRVETLRGTLDEATGAITKNTRATVANDLAEKGMLERAKGLGLSLSLVTDAALGNQGALDQLVGSLDSVIEAGTRHVVAGNRAATMLSSEALSARALKEELLSQSGALGTAQQQQRLAAEGAEEHKTAQQLAAEAIRKSNVKIQAQNQDLDDLIETSHRASGAALTLSGSQIAYQQAIDDAAASVKEHGRTLDLDTEKGRSNRGALNDLAKSANDQTDALLRSGKGYGAAQKNATDARAEFVRVATQMTGNKAKAEALARELIDIPKNVNTDVKNNAAAAKAKALDYKRNGLDNVPKTVSTGVTVTGIPAAQTKLTDFARDADRTLASIKDEAIRVSLGYTSSLGQNPKNKNNFAYGGPVTGGIPGKDSVPGMLMPGEHVLDTGDVKKMGGQAGVYEFRRNLHGFAKGGAVKLNMRTPTFEQVAAVTSGVARRAGSDIARERSTQPLNFAYSQVGKPYVWGGVGPGGYDCSGFMSAITNFILGRKPYSRLFATGSFPTSMFAPGMGNFSIGSVRGNPGHMAGTLNGTNVESRGGDGVVVGAGARGARHPMFGSPYHLKGFAKGGAVDGDPPFDVLDPRGKHFRDLQPMSFDQGGYLPMGTSFVHNGTGRPEPVGHDLLRRGDKIAFTITNWQTGAGYIRGIARDEVNGNNEFKARTGRMR
jgi:TP901 family phage tail tape measure protein